MSVLVEYCITCNQEILENDALDDSTFDGIYAHNCCRWKNCEHF